MDMTDPAFQMIAYELAGIFAVLVAWPMFKAYKKSKRIQSEAKASVKEIKRLRDRGLDNIKEVLTEKYGLEGDALQQASNEIKKLEQQIYKSQVAMYVEQDNKKLRANTSELQKLVDTCLDFLPIGPETQQQEKKPDAIDEVNQKTDQLLVDMKHLGHSNLRVETEAAQDEIISELHSQLQSEEEAKKLIQQPNLKI